jgi:hypothetical protein
MNMDDLLLKELGNLAQREEEAERARFDERWDRLTAGSLTAEQETELKALAGSSPEARETYEAFRPLGADFQARVVSAINSERASEAPEAEPREEKPRVLPFRRVARRVEVWFGAAAAAAAGVFFLVHSPSQLPVPHPTVEVIGGDKATRGGDSGPTSGMRVFSPGSMLELRVGLQPPQKTRDLEAHAFRVHAGKEKEPWASVSGFNVDKGDNGVIRLRGEVGEQIQLPVGLWQICVVISRPGKSPQEGELSAALRERHTDWQMDCSDRIRVKDSS